MNKTTLISIWKISSERGVKRIIQFETNGFNMSDAIDHLKEDIENISVSHGEEGRTANLLTVYLKETGEIIPQSWYYGYLQDNKEKITCPKCGSPNISGNQYYSECKACGFAGSEYEA